MSFCRICRTPDNLKYTLKELRRINKKLETNPKDLIYAAPATQTGNICYDCEERLHNFNKHINGDSDVDVECASAVLREDSPVIVDDDELLYNLFFQKQHCLAKQAQERSHPQPEHRPYTQHSLGSDGDTEIIEVLTSSRESTPFHDDIINNVPNLFATPTQSLVNVVPNPSQSLVDTVPNESQHLANAVPNVSQDFINAVPIASQIVVNTVPIEVIDLAADDKNAESDDEEIVFRHVETDPAKNCSETKKVQRKRKRISENETKLVASLSLISSDSEDEDAQPLKKLALKVTPLPQIYACSFCELKFNDSVSLQKHQSTHNLASCPVCNASFALSQRLVKHMRTKHRSYSGDTLKERAKCAQDSAMTIRLRYQHRYTFYECQLCGKIDGVFKEHKEHIMQEHASESKSLNDPMMKELKCPLCKTTCGALYMTLCEHLRVTHRDEHTPHLNEMKHTHPFGWSAERQNDIEKTSRVFQFLARKGRYFECMTCNNISPGYFNHWKHLSSRTCSALSYKNEPTSITKPKVAPLKIKVETSAKNNENSVAVKPMDKPKAAPLRVKVETSAKNNENCIAVKPMDTKKPQKSAEKPKKKKEHVKDKKTALNAASAPKSTNVRKEPAKKVNKKANFKVPAVVKVKVKPHLLTLSTLEYICKYCKLIFKGFSALNLHQLKCHSGDEYDRCQKCSKLYKKSNDIKQEFIACPQCASLYQLNELEQNKNPPCMHHRRKCRKPTTASSGRRLSKLNMERRDDEMQEDACIQTVNGNSSSELRDITVAENSTKNQDWLTDLMQFASGAKETYQCEYCTRLFAEESLMITHQQQHDERKDTKLLKRISHKRVVR